MARKNWSEKTPEEQFQTICWSVATSSAIESGENPLDIYKRLLNKETKLPIGLKEKE
jgi:hypothetical protein